MFDGWLSSSHFVDLLVGRSEQLLLGCRGYYNINYQDPIFDSFLKIKLTNHNIFPVETKI